MKKYLFLLMLALAFVATSCSSDDDFKLDGDGEIIRIHFTKSPSTKGYLDDAAKTESFEKSISSVSVLVYEATGDQNFLLQHDADATEISNSKLVFLLPRGMEEKQLTFLAIANHSLESTPKTLSEAYSLLESDIAAYNGTFAQVSAGALRTGGFAMSAIAADMSVSSFEINEIYMPLERTVAKIAIKSSISGTFSQKYSGSIKITNVTIGNLSSKTLSISPSLSGSTKIDDASKSLSQVPGASGNELRSLFYSYEKKTGKALVTIDGTYDADGDFSSTKDQTAVTYQFEIAELLKRNAYYRLDVLISGLEGSECDMTLAVKDWAGPYSQEITLGR